MIKSPFSPFLTLLLKVRWGGGGRHIEITATRSFSQEATISRLDLSDYSICIPGIKPKSANLV